MATSKISVDGFTKYSGVSYLGGLGDQEATWWTDEQWQEYEEYCKKLEAELDKLNDVTIYTFIYPLKAQSIAVSKSIWCDPNQAYAWKNLLQKNVQPKEKTCTNPIDRNLELGKKLGIEGTPTLIFGNGLKMVGGRSAEDIRMIWKELGL